MASQSVKLPPVICGPHSIRWPHRLPAASRSKSPAIQPNSCISGPSTSALSTERPVITTSAPAANAAAIGVAPRYAFMLSSLSADGNGALVRQSPMPLLRNSSARATRSSPSTIAMRSEIPFSSATLRKARAQAAGFMPPALVMTLMPCALISCKCAPTALTKSGT